MSKNDNFNLVSSTFSSWKVIPGAKKYIVDFFLEKWHFPFGFVDFSNMKSKPWSVKCLWIIFLRKMTLSNFPKVSSTFSSWKLFTGAKNKILLNFFPRKMTLSLWFRRLFQVEKCSLWSKINVLWNYAYEKWHFPFSLIDSYKFKREHWSEKIYWGFFSLEEWHFPFDSVDFFKLKSYPWSEKIIVAILFSLPKKILEFRSLCFPVGFVDFSSWKVPNP